MISFHRIAAVAATAAMILSACSGPQPSGSSVVPGSGAARAGKSTQPTEFVSDWNNDVVDVIKGGVAVRSIDVTGPEGLTVDAEHNLYVTNVAGSNVLVYAPPYTGSPIVLDDAGYRPSDVAVDANGNVAIASTQSNAYGLGSVAFYPKGATEPARTIVANGRFAGDYYCAFDASDNLFLTSKSGSG